MILSESCQVYSEGRILTGLSLTSIRRVFGLLRRWTLPGTPMLDRIARSAQESIFLVLAKLGMIHCNHCDSGIYANRSDWHPVKVAECQGVRIPGIAYDINTFPTHHSSRAKAQSSQKYLGKYRTLNAPWQAQHTSIVIPSQYGVDTKDISYILFLFIQISIALSTFTSPRLYCTLRPVSLRSHS